MTKKSSFATPRVFSQTQQKQHAEQQDEEEKRFLRALVRQSNENENEYTWLIRDLSAWGSTYVSKKKRQREKKKRTNSRDGCWWSMCVSPTRISSGDERLRVKFNRRLSFANVYLDRSLMSYLCATEVNSTRQHHRLTMMNWEAEKLLECELKRINCRWGCHCRGTGI